MALGLKKRLYGTGMTVGTAESCTGGNIAALIASVPGASDYFLGSVVSYAVPVKESLLGVPPETIEQFGVVSEEVARSMAEGIRNRIGCTYSVSTTGLAGPSGDERNPVGTVCIGVSGPRGTVSLKKTFPYDRKGNISHFSTFAVRILLSFIENDLNCCEISSETIMF
ncbi:MAG: CinA family protein [Bacteroidales bacterium]|nr:CinA family protein [Bacteroidales bacterium]